MHWSIYGEEEEKYRNTQVALKELESGKIHLFAVDDSNNPISRGALLTIDPDGTVHFHRHINPAFGLKTNEEGRLVIGKDYL